MQLAQLEESGRLSGGSGRLCVCVDESQADCRWLVRTWRRVKQTVSWLRYTVEKSRADCQEAYVKRVCVKKSQGDCQTADVDYEE